METTKNLLFITISYLVYKIEKLRIAICNSQITIQSQFKIQISKIRNHLICNLKPLILLFFFLAYSFLSFSQGLIAHYPFNGNANDSTGNGQDGTINGGVTDTTDRFGNANSAYYFNGSNGYIEIPHAEALDFPENEFTISSWVYSEDATTSQMIIFKGTSNTDLRYSTYFTNGLNEFRTVVGNSNNIAGDYVAEPFNQWIHVVGKYKDGILTSYVNGQENGSLSIDFTSVAPSTENLLIGKVGGDSQYMNGRIDDVRLYNRALLDVEIDSLYGKGGWTSLNQGLIAHYPFNGNANDESGNGNDGIENGGVALTTDRFGNANSAYSFDGTDDFIDVGNFDVGERNAITLSAWVYVDILSDGGHIIDRWLGTGNQREFELTFDSDDSIHFALGDNTGVLALKASSKGNISGTGWRLIVGTWDANGDGHGRIYLDGVHMGTSKNTLTEPYIITTEPTYIGGDFRYTDGKIDDVRIYNRVISESEISTLFTEGGWSSLNSGLIAHYPFNGNANDSTGNGHDGTINGGVTPITDRFGNANSAYDFDGTDGYIEIPHAEALDFPENEFTISSWIYSEDATSNQPIVVKGTTSDTRYSTYLTNAQNEFRIIVDAAGNIAGDYVSEPFDQWIHVVAQYKDGMLNTYVNGQDNGSLAYDFTVVPASLEDVFIGKLGGTDQFMDGRIDDVRLYNRALLDVEIDSLYGKGGWTSLNQGLVAHYPFNGNTNDESGNGNDGTENGGVALTTDRFGNANSAYSFDGTDDYLDLPTTDLLNGETEITYSTWIYLNVDSQNFPGIIYHTFGSNKGNGFTLNPDNTITARYTFDSDEGVQTSILQIGKWYYIASTYKGGIAKIYVNGILDNTVSITDGTTVKS